MALRLMCRDFLLDPPSAIHHLKQGDTGTFRSAEQSYRCMRAIEGLPNGSRFSCAPLERTGQRNKGKQHDLSTFSGLATPRSRGTEPVGRSASCKRLLGGACFVGSRWKSRKLPAAYCCSDHDCSAH